MVTCNKCGVNRDVKHFIKFMRFCDDCWEECNITNDHGIEIDKELIY